MREGESQRIRGEETEREERRERGEKYGRWRSRRNKTRLLRDYCYNPSLFVGLNACYSSCLLLRSIESSLISLPELSFREGEDTDGRLC